MTVKKIDKNSQGTVAILAANGASVSKIARETGLHHKTVKAVLKVPAIIELKERIEERLADKFESLAETILNSICEADLEKASLQQKSVSAACMVDKSRLIRGLSTNNAAVIYASAIELAFQRPTGKLNN